MSSNITDTEEFEVFQDFQTLEDLVNYALQKGFRSEIVDFLRNLSQENLWFTISGVVLAKSEQYDKYINTHKILEFLKNLNQIVESIYLIWGQIYIGPYIKPTLASIFSDDSTSDLDELQF